MSETMQRGTIEHDAKGAVKVVWEALQRGERIHTAEFAESAHETLVIRKTWQPAFHALSLVAATLAEQDAEIARLWKLLEGGR